MEIKNLKLPNNIINFYLDSGIKQLYPPQADAIKKGLLNGKNIFAAIPTASGKTLLAELAMLKSITENGKVLYIVPLRALASEKYDRFLEFDSIGVKTTISTGDFELKDEKLGDIHDIIVTTSEKADSLLRNKTSWMEQISVIVVDEVHLIDSSNRGPTLEMIITKFKIMNPRIQIIALSATIGNAKELSSWLDAELILSDWRPIDLREGVFFEDSIIFNSNNDGGCQKQIIPKYSNNFSINLVIDIIKKDGQCLIFDNSRRNAIGVARKASVHTSKYISKRTKNALSEISNDIIESGETEVAELLAECVQNGVAFHHAGLNSNHRKLIEKGFKENKIKMIASTPTLAAGLNLPARRVIIKNYKRYDSQFGMQPIPIIEYKQMAGRAGRPHLDPYGESIILSKSKEECENLFKDYIYAQPESVLSKLGTEQAIRSHVLSLISTGFANNRPELMDFMTATFFSYQNDPIYLMQVVDKCINFLCEHKMVVQEINDLNETFYSTKLGNLISILYIDPLSGANIVDGLKKSEIFTDLSILHLICTTPNMKQLYLRATDYEQLNDFVVTHKSDFIQIPSQFKTTEYEWFLSEVKTAILLKDWIEEMQITTITKKFNIGEGDVRVFVELAEWLMHATAIIAGILDINNDIAKILEKRIQYGVSSNLVELAKIHGIGRIRARLLYMNGFKSKEDIKNADFKEVSKIIGHKLAIKIFQQVKKDFVYEHKIVEAMDSNSENQTTFGDF